MFIHEHDGRGGGVDYVTLNLFGECHKDVKSWLLNRHTRDEGGFFSLKRAANGCVSAKNKADGCNYEEKW